MNLSPMNLNFSYRLLALRCCITLLLLSLTASCADIPSIFEIDLSFSVSNGAATNKNYIETGDTATLSWALPTNRTALDQHLISLTIAGQAQAINTAAATQSGTMQVSPTLTTIYTMTAVYQYNTSSGTTVTNMPVTLFVDEPKIADVVTDPSLQNCFTVTYANQFNETILDCSSQLPPIADLTGIGNFTTLETLLLNDNSITDILPVASLTNLKILRFGDNLVSDINPIGGLTKLRSLTIENNGGIADVVVLATVLSTMKSNILLQPSEVIGYVDADGLPESACTILENLGSLRFNIDASQCCFIYKGEVCTP